MGVGIPLGHVEAGHGVDLRGEHAHGHPGRPLLLGAPQRDGLAYLDLRSSPDGLDKELRRPLPECRPPGRQPLKDHRLVGVGPHELVGSQR